MAQLVSLIRIEWIVIYQADSVIHILNIRGQLAPIFQKVDNALHWINLYPVVNAIGFPNTYPLNSDFSVGLRYPTFEQLEPRTIDWYFRK